jgi:hypothetical protein
MIKLASNLTSKWSRRTGLQLDDAGCYNNLFPRRSFRSESTHGRNTSLSRITLRYKQGEAE